MGYSCAATFCMIIAAHWRPGTGEMTSRLQRLIAVTTLLVAAAQPAAADAVADFYKGKTVTVVVGHEVGTGFDVYARTLQRHLRRHIPGNPAVVVQNMSAPAGSPPPTGSTMPRRRTAPRCRALCIRCRSSR